MKRFFSLLCVSTCMLTAMAQFQIQNPSFEEWDNEGTSSIEPSHWNSFMSGTGSMKGFAAAQQVQKSDDAHSGSHSARIYARSVFGVVAQGNLTTGCINMGSATATDANGNYNYTNESDEAFHQKFTGLPDAMRVWVKASCAFPAGASCNLHTAGYFQDPAGNTITATRIAKANTSEIASSNEWQEVVIPFEYYMTDGIRPAYALITLTTSGTPGKGNASDYMLVDDVEFLYYSELQAIIFNGKEVTITGSTTTIDGTYDEALLQLKSNGQGASIKTYYMESSKTLTVTISGDDISNNPGNKHTYTLVFTGKENDGPTPDPEPEPEPQPAISIGSLVPFGDFEAWKNSCGTTHQVGSGGGDRQRPGIEPEGWNGSSVYLRINTFSDCSEVLVEKVAGADGSGSAVKLTNKSFSYFGNRLTSAGYVTYGNQWSWTGTLNFMSSDWGTYGGRPYTKRPDAIRGQFKRPATNENAHIIAYLWKGIIHGRVGAFDSPSTEYDDLDRAIMGHAEVSSGDGQLIASCDHTFTETKDGDWETITVPLTYTEGQEEAIPEKMNIIISSGDYWTRSVQAGNTLEADNIEFLFYSELATATYNGEALHFDESNKASVATAYDSARLSLTASGRSASIETSYDTLTHILTITVKGGDHAENAQNQHVYTVQFPFFSELASATYNGSPVNFDIEHAAEVDNNYVEANLNLTPNDDAAVIQKEYDSATRILTITVKGGNYNLDPTNVHTYTIHFLPQEKVVSERSYTDQIQIKINDADNSLQNATITLQEWNTGMTSLILKNFRMGNSNTPMNVGSIVVNDIQMGADGKFQINCNTTIQAGDDPADATWLGPVLGPVPLQIEGQELRGRDVPDSLHVHIIIDLVSRMGQSVDVLFGKSLIDGGSGGDDPGSSTISLPDKQDYEDDLIVTLNGSATAPQRTVISVEYHRNSNTLDLILKNFGLKDGETDMPVGTIHVKNIPYTIKSGVPYATFRKDVTVSIEEGDDPNVSMWMGPMLGEIPITLAGKTCKEKLYCTIDINMTGVGVIHVDFGTDGNWPKIDGGGDTPTPIENPILKDRTYTDVLEVTVNGISGKPEEYQVEMTVSEEGLVTLSLKNFILTAEDGETIPVGNVEVTDITPVEMPRKDYYLFEAAQSITIKEGDDKSELWAGPYFGEIPISMSGKIALGKLYCNISIFLAEMKENIRVVFGESFTDAIEGLTADPSLSKRGEEGSVYNLAGQRLDNSPSIMQHTQLKRGIYIVNGKKVLVK